MLGRVLTTETAARDAIHSATPVMWAEFFERNEMAEYLRTT